MTFHFVLALHSLLRWLVVLCLLAAWLQALAAWRAGHPWTGRHRATNIALVAGFDLQVLVGLYLYLFLSPLPRAAFLDGQMRSRDVRFFALEHPTMMLVSLVLIHVGHVRAKQAETDRERHRQALIWFGVATVFVLGSIPWPGYVVFRPWFPGF